jgi:hypothetical protein
LQNNVFDERFAAKTAFHKNNGWRFISASFIKDSAVILEGVFQHTFQCLLAKVWKLESNEFNKVRHRPPRRQFKSML